MKFDIFPWRSLKTKITLYTLVIFLIGIWSLAFYGSRTLRENMQNMISQQQFSTVSLMSDEVNDELKSRQRALDMVASSIDPHMLGDRDALQALLEQRPVFQDMFNAGTFVTGKDGTAIATFPVGSGVLGLNYMDRDYIVAALQQGRSSIGRPVVGKVLGRPLFAMATPIRDEQGRVMGALIGVIDLSKPSFLDHLTHSQYGKSGGYLLIAPRQRLIVAASDKSRIMETLAVEGIHPSIERYLQGFEGPSILVNPRGEELLVAVKGIPTTGWYTAVYLPTAEAFAPIGETQTRMLLATLLLTLLAGGSTWWILKRQLAPLQSAASALATQSERGKPLQSLPVARPDEIGQLIAAFNRLLVDLGQSEERYRAAFQTSPDAVNINRMSDGVFLDVNDAFSRLVAWPRCDVIGRSDAEINIWYKPEDRKKLVQALQRDGYCENMDADFVARDGRRLTALLSAHVLELNGERCILSVTRDITEKLQLGAKARLVESHLTSVVESASDLMISTDAQGLITSWNAAAQRLTGYLVEQVRGQALADFCEKSQRKDMALIIRQLVAGTVFEFFSEINVMASSGALIPVDWSFSVLHDEAGTVCGVVVVGRDLLERRALEQHLYQSEKLAALGVLAGGIAHELRNPLAVSFSAAQFLQELPADPAFQQECIGKILDGIERSSAIIENLLRFARPTARDQMEALDLVHVVRDTVTVLSPQARLQKISLVEHHADATLPISGNVNLLQQVVMNLVLNAFQATPAGGAVEVSTRREGDQVVLKVRDTGSGISPAHLKRIFDPFFTTRAVGQGTGLGLSICHTVIKQHGGSIVVESSVEGQGTCFVVRLPIAQVSA
jgi:PAS domain S-box-containing protein